MASQTRRGWCTGRLAIPRHHHCRRLHTATSLTNRWLAVILGLTILVAPSVAQDSLWKAEHDAGWSAYKPGRLAEAERRLRSSERAGRALSQNDPDLATVLDHLARVLIVEGKVADAQPLAKSALILREKALGEGHPDIVKNLNTLAAITEMDGELEEAKAF
jgi:hypothetical protein